MKVFASWFGLVWLTSQGLCTLLPHVLSFLIAPTIQSHEIWNLWPKWEAGKIEGSPSAEAGGPKRLYERIHETHIVSSLVLK